MSRSIVTAAAVVVLAACGGDSATDRDAAAASEAWSAYKAAILDKNGAAAVGYLSKDTIAYYEEVRVLALEADRRALAPRALVDRLGVITMRVALTSEELKRLNGTGLVREAVNRGLIGEAGTTNTELGSVRVAGDTANGDLVTPDGQTGGRLDFRRESGAWKIHLVTLIKSVDLALRQTARERGLTEDDFILEIVGAARGKSLTHEVWDPSKF